MSLAGEGPNRKQKIKVRVIDKTTNYPVPEMITIPGGEFLMGTSDEQITFLTKREDWAQDWQEEGNFFIEQPMHYVELSPFKIGKYPITNLEYSNFIWDCNYKIPKGWIGFRFPEGMDRFPVVGITWNDATAYCDWLSRKTKLPYRLPNEAEWERAARGIDGRIFPWGDEFDPWRANTIESRLDAACSVDMYIPAGLSYDGVAGMSGNVWDWTSSRLLPYPFHIDPIEEEINSVEIKRGYVVRGGAWYYSRKLARCCAREVYRPDYISPALGFRIALSIE
jgi:toxoflavin biosynthesis protein ToxD